MKYRVTITQNNGKRAVCKSEGVDALGLLYRLEHCHFKSFSISIES